MAARAHKVKCTPYCCSRAVGTRWSLRPRIMHWFYSTVIEHNLLYGVAFWWTALNRQHNVILFDKVRRSAAIYVTGALRISLTRALFTTLSLLPTVLRSKQTAKFSATKLKVLSRFHIVPSGQSTISQFYPVNPRNTDYLPAKYCLERDFYSLIPNRDDWNPNTVFSLNC